MNNENNTPMIMPISMIKEFENEFGIVYADRFYKIFTIVLKNDGDSPLEEIKKFLFSIEERVDLLHEEAENTDDMSVKQDFVHHFTVKLLMNNFQFIHKNEQEWSPVVEAFKQMMKAQGLDFDM